MYFNPTKTERKHQKEKKLMRGIIKIITQGRDKGRIDR